ncbi:MAG: helix-turn-helix transcriptional regulator [Paracraurococcus sp.]
MFTATIDILQWLGIGQCLFAAALLGLSPRHAEPTDRWLAVALLAVTISDILGVAERALPQAAPLLRAANLLDFAAIAPAIWMHLWHLLGPAPGEHPGRWRHAAVLAPTLPLVALSATGWGPATPILYLMLQGQQGLYLAAGLRRVRRRAALPGGDPIRVRWTLSVMAVLAVVWALNLAEFGLRRAGLDWPGLGPLMELPPIIGFFLVSLLAFERPREALARVEARIAPPDPEAGKYSRSGLQPEARDRLARRLTRALADEAVLTDPAMTLARMARALNASENDVSQVANQVLGRRFPELLAAARIRLAMARLRDPAHAGRTVLEVALDVGFNSKSTFNAAFKREAGVTPTAWRDEAPPAAPRRPQPAARDAAETWRPHA